MGRWRQKNLRESLRDFAAETLFEPSINHSLSSCIMIDSWILNGTFPNDIDNSPNTSEIQNSALSKLKTKKKRNQSCDVIRNILSNYSAFNSKITTTKMLLDSNTVSVAKSRSESRKFFWCHRPIYSPFLNVKCGFLRDHEPSHP